MSAVALVVVFAVLVAVAILGPIYGVDTRPTAADPPERWFGDPV